MEKENREKRSWPVYTFLLILLVLVVLLAGIIIWQFTRINALYSQSQAQIESVVSSLQELVDFSKQTIPANDETQPKISVNITYPPTLETQSTFDSLLNTIQTESTRSLSSINNLLMIFSILITVVVIVVPIFNYAFIQKDQIRKLEKQFFEFGKKFSAIEKQASVFEAQFSRYETRFSEFEGKFNETNERISNETKRLEGSIKQAIIVATNLASSRTEKISEDITPISDSPEDQAQALALDAELSFSKDRFDDAIRKITDAICLVKDNADYYARRSFMYHMRGKYIEALADATKAIELDPNNARYYNNRSATLHELKRYEDALIDVTKAIELDPQNAKYYNSRSVTLLELKRFEEALVDSTKAIEFEPKNARYYDDRGTALFKLGRIEEALADETKAIELDPKNARYYSNRGAALHDIKRYEDALIDSNKAIELDPQNPFLYDSRSTTLRLLKQYKKALLDAEKAYELDKKYRYELAWVLYLNGQYRDALNNVEIIQDGCDSYLAFRTRALARIRIELLMKKKVSSKFIDEVKADLERAIELQRLPQYGYIRYAEAMILLNQLPEAYEKLEKAIEMDPEEPEVYHWLAEYYRAIGDAKKAKINDKLADIKGYIPEPKKI